MKIVMFFLLVFCSGTILLAGSDVNSLACDDIMQGLKSHSKSDTYPELKARQKWMNDLWLKQTMLTNEVERVKLTKELTQILNSGKSSNEDKCAAAYLIGLFRLKEGIKALINNFLLVSKAALEPDLRPAEGGMPSKQALTTIGEQSLPEVVELIESTTNSYTLKCGTQVILGIKGQEEGAKFLKQAIANQADSKKKENLKAALSSEYFTDSKYQASGPHMKQKIIGDVSQQTTNQTAVGIQQIRGLEKTNDLGALENVGKP